MLVEALAGFVGLLVVAAGLVVWRLRAPSSILPGPKKTHWLSGSLGELSVDPNRPRYLRMFDLVKQYGETMCLSGYGRLFVTISGPKAIQDLLSMKSLPLAINIRESGSLLTNGLITLLGDMWQRHRTLTQKAFTIATLKTAVSIVQESALALSAEFDKSIASETSVNVNDVFVRMTETVICKLAFGGKPIPQLIKLLNEVGDEAAKRLECPKFLWPFLFKNNKEVLRKSQKIREYVRDMVEVVRRDQLPKDASQLTNANLLQMLLIQQQNEETPFTDEEVIEEAIMFYVGGFETTASALTSLLHKLCEYPHVVDLMYNEIVAVCGHEGEVTWEQVHELNYVENVCKELLRIQPVLPGVSREMETDVKIGEHVIPKGSIVIASFYAIHHNPEYWPEPERFDPDRFLQIPRQHTYFPFGYGAKMCIGNRLAMLEMKTSLAYIVRDFTNFRIDSARPGNLHHTFTVTHKNFHMYMDRRVHH